MTYSGQESAYDPSGNAEQEAEQASYDGLHRDWELDQYKRAEKEDWSDVDRIQAVRDESVGRGGLPAIGNHRTISAEWMEASVTDGTTIQSQRSRWPYLAALDAERILHDAFDFMRPSLESFVYCFPSSPDGETPYLRSIVLEEVKREFMGFGSARIQISRITLSEGWPNDAK